MQPRLTFVKTRKYYQKRLSSNKYISNTTQTNESISNYFENIPITTTSHRLSHKEVLPIIWFSILQEQPPEVFC